MQLLCPENFYKPHAFNETMKEIPLPCEQFIHSLYPIELRQLKLFSSVFLIPITNLQ